MKKSSRNRRVDNRKNKNTPSILKGTSFNTAWAGGNKEYDIKINQYPNPISMEYIERRENELPT